jgi:hypothetical protein
MPEFRAKETNKTITFIRLLVDCQGVLLKDIFIAGRVENQSSDNLVN